MSPNQPASGKSQSTDSRRSFVAAVLTVLAGGVAMLIPLVTGVIAFCSPLRRKQAATKVRVALLSQVPADGRPRSFPVITERIDAWTKHPAQRVGSVYLVRSAGEASPVAFTAKCPHAGCFIGYTLGDSNFRCPCHTSAFNLDGTRSRGDEEVSPRDMDRLPVELRPLQVAGGEEESEIWIEFIDFQTGHKEAIPSA